jgi:hypothetical protein
MPSLPRDAGAPAAARMRRTDERLPDRRIY